MQNFCQTLQSPAHQGNWDLDVGGKKLEIRLGLTPNDFTYPQFRTYELTLKNFDLLAPDFKKELGRINYPSQLKKLIQSEPLSHYSVTSRKDDVYLNHAVEDLWKDAIHAVRIERMEKLHPGYSKLRQDERPPVWRREETEIETQMTIENHRAIWESSPEWSRVQTQFEEVRSELMGLIERSREMASNSKKRYLDRIRSVKLLPPGTSRRHLEDNCSDDLANAFYMAEDNTIEICAGLLISVNALFTVSHELGHTLDPDTSARLALIEAAPGKLVRKLHQDRCENHQTDCAAWNISKKTFAADTLKIPSLEFNPSSFFGCFRKKKVKPLSSAWIRERSDQWVNEDVQKYADNSDFIAMTKAEMQLPNGQKYPNPAYLNPCGLPTWDRSRSDDPVNSSDPVLFFFASEYACTEALEPSERLRNAIEVAKKLQDLLYEASLRIGGPYSTLPALVDRGFSEDIGERVADALGAQVTAAIISKEKDLLERRRMYFSVLADRCDLPDWKTLFPKEADVENDYSADPHTHGMKRLQETMLPAMRELVQCQKDFDLPGCELN